jgi:hypothetical protein
MMVPQLAVLVEPLKPTAVPWMCEDAAAGALIMAVGFRLQVEAVEGYRREVAMRAMRVR